MRLPRIGTSDRIVIRITAGLLAFLPFTGMAAAQVETVGEAMCGSGLGSLFTFLLAAIALFLVVLAAVRGMFAFNKLGSHRSDEKREGKDQLKGAGITFAGAFVPLVFAGILDVLGVNTISCLNFDIGILVIAVPV